MSETRQEWNYRPEIPLAVNPLFVWPPNPVAIVRWLWNSWFLISERLILVGVALISWFYLQPALETCKTFAVGWIAQMYARNLALMILVAGGLHLWFYVVKGQGKVKKFDPRDKPKRGKIFTFGNQVHDNMFWTLASGVTVWTAYEALTMWAFANGYISFLNWHDNPVWFVLLFLLVPVWESFHFYWIHRALHWPPLYRFAHNLHHRNTDVGPWSGLSMHPLEHVMFLGSIWIHWLISSHPVHLLYHMQYLTLTAATTHTGFESLVVRDKDRLALGTFHHQMHHRYFECNYGGLEMPWDKWFGSFHDGTAEAGERMKERRKRMAG
ncbi:MAG: sterol desaturase family protein [Hyphomicrobiaceae bacterium]